MLEQEERALTQLRCAKVIENLSGNGKRILRELIRPSEEIKRKVAAYNEQVPEVERIQTLTFSFVAHAVGLTEIEIRNVRKEFKKGFNMRFG